MTALSVVVALMAAVEPTQVPTLLYPGGWHLAHETSCDAECASSGLVCTAEGMHSHNSDVDSSEKLKAVIAQAGGPDSFPGSCSTVYGFNSDVPQFNTDVESGAGTNCHASAPGRPLDTHSCQQTAGYDATDRWRVCYCHLAPSAWPGLNMDFESFTGSPDPAEWVGDDWRSPAALDGWSFSNANKTLRLHPQEANKYSHPSILIVGHQSAPWGGVGASSGDGNYAALQYRGATVEQAIDLPEAAAGVGITVAFSFAGRPNYPNPGLSVYVNDRLLFRELNVSETHFVRRTLYVPPRYLVGRVLLLRFENSYEYPTRGCGNCDATVFLDEVRLRLSDGAADGAGSTDAASDTALVALLAPSAESRVQLLLGSRETSITRAAEGVVQVASSLIADDLMLSSGESLRRIAQMNMALQARIEALTVQASFPRVHTAYATEQESGLYGTTGATSKTNARTGQLTLTFVPGCRRSKIHVTYQLHWGFASPGKFQGARVGPWRSTPGATSAQAIDVSSHTYFVKPQGWTSHEFWQENSYTGVRHPTVHLEDVDELTVGAVGDSVTYGYDYKAYVENSAQGPYGWQRAIATEYCVEQ